MSDQKPKKNLHPLLERQLEQIGSKEKKDFLPQLLKVIDTAYQESDRERKLLEHTMTVMTEELMEANEVLTQQTVELRKSQQRYELAATAANDGLWDLDCETGNVFFSKRFKESISITEDRPFSRLWDWFELIHPDHRKNVESVFEQHILGKIDRIEVEYKIQSGSRYIWCMARGLATRDENKKAVRIAGSQTDITKNKDHEAELKQAAFHDDLTGLPNRSLFINRLEQVVEREKRLGESPAAVVFVDLDKFKHINDTLGHDYGDAVLMYVAEIIKNNIRGCDTVARLGGDEFTILLDLVQDLDDALSTANRILRKLNKTYKIKKKEVFIGASMGLTMLDRTSTNPESILRNADLAMYHAKSSKKGSIEVFDSGQHQKLLERMEIESELRNVCQKKELELHYQPIVDLKTGNISSFEALVRWYHPTKGVVSPAKFIPLAEESGLIGKIGEEIVIQVIDCIEKWIGHFGEKGCPPIGVNLSPIQVVDPNCFDSLLYRFKKSEILCQKIRIEITETAIMSDPEAVENNLKKLRDLGVKLCIDDFGTGYSSLSYLHSFSYDVLKIDRDFVTMITVDPKLERLVSNIIRLSNDLGLETVAEGIETEEQMLKLAQLGCDKGQGFLFSKALNYRLASQIIESGKTFPIKRTSTRSEGLKRVWPF